jgi:sialate O-acetylesterase
MKFLLSFIISICFALPLTAEVRLPHVFSDHAVLQRDQPVRVWGWARPEEHVSVIFHRQSRTAVADSYGRWETWLMPEPAGGPYTLAVNGDATASPVTRHDILLGDVWIASGQSNMQMPLKGFNPDTQVKDHGKEIAEANHPRIRLLLQKLRPAMVPMDDTADTWTVCTPDTARNFSAVAYFFGRAVQEHENIPIGLIDTSQGGTPVMSWTSAEGAAYANVTSIYTNGATAIADQALADEVKANWAVQDAADKAADRKPASRAHIVDRGNTWIPASLYNGMIAPYTRYAIKGVIWYQGEADQYPQTSAPFYARVFSSMIQDWRHQWSQGDFPFLFVQLTSYKSDTPDGWSIVRDAQRRTLSLANTGMAVTLDLGNPSNIHPADKQTVGARLAAVAFNVAYGSKQEGTSPVFVQATSEPGGMRAWFTHADKLAVKSGAVEGFEIAGPDHNFVPAEAHIEKIGDRETVVATAPSITEPKYIRYGWSSVVTNLLYNSAGLPLGTFTSEP